VPAEAQLLGCFLFVPANFLKASSIMRRSMGRRFGRISAGRVVLSGCPAPRLLESEMRYEIANQDIDKPLLVLMGEDDNETLPSICVPKLEGAKAAGAPVEWHVYPKSTHCFDCRHLNGFSKTVSGRKVIYYYDDKITEDATRRLFAFLEKSMPK
jgi:dienelactone hydrolase